MVLMLKDKAVAEFGSAASWVEVIERELLPHEILEYLDDSDISDRVAMLLRSWLFHRVGKSNPDYELICSAIGAAEDEQVIDILKRTRAVSAYDSYWIKDNADFARWEDVDSLANYNTYQIPETRDTVTSVDLTTDGKQEKYWQYSNTGMQLIKGSGGHSRDSVVECMVTAILDKCNVRHVHYTAVKEFGAMRVRCNNLHTDKLMLVPLTDCSRTRSLPKDIAIKLDSDLYYKTCIVDYLIGKRARMLYALADTDTNKLVGLAPIFNNGDAFDEEALKAPQDVFPVYSDKNLEEAALDAMKHVDFHFTAVVEPEDFINKEMYEGFMNRARNLGVVGNYEERLRWTLDAGCKAVNGVKNIGWRNYVCYHYGAPKTLEERNENYGSTC